MNREFKIQDEVIARFRIALFLSLIINFIFLWIISDTVHRHVYQTSAPVEITRLILKEPKTEKAAVKKQIEKPQAKPLQKAVKASMEEAHHHVVTAKNLPEKAAAIEHAAIAGGNAEIGKPIEHQGPGNAVTSPSPLPVGPTEDATPANQVYPEIPEELQNENYQSSVRVKVDIAANGTFNVTLRTSSGNMEIDRRVLAALKEWRWKPALKNGVPIASTQLFRFDFEVR